MGCRAARRARPLGAEQEPWQLLLALKPPCCRGQGAGFFGAWHIQTSHVSALGTEGLWPMGTPLGSADPLHYGHVVCAFGCLPSRLVAGGVNKAGARCLASASWFPVSVGSIPGDAFSLLAKGTALEMSQEARHRLPRYVSQLLRSHGPEQREGLQRLGAAAGPPRSLNSSARPGGCSRGLFVGSACFYCELPL